MDFNPLHREGGDIDFVFFALSSPRFQSTPPRGWRRFLAIPKQSCAGNFNPLHREGGDTFTGFCAGWIFDFNPLHREGGDTPEMIVQNILLDISIHSTARVETITFGDSTDYVLISIHSTARVETLIKDGTCIVPDDFNPLHREGGDDFNDQISVRGEQFQSTPPRGWRHFMREESPGEYSDFNPLHREGGDWVNSSTRWSNSRFQSTPPRGWRLLARTKPPWARRDFNPLHREGGDCRRYRRYNISIKFQSTPPRGWRQQYYTITTTILHHISTNKSYPTPLKSRPTIPAHSQIRSHCANFPVRIPP